MSSIPIITHRMLVAAAVQERRPPELLAEIRPPWPEDRLAEVEVLDPAEWNALPMVTPALAPAPPRDFEV